ncbi:N-acetylmuramic acid 6-phosphate etherase [Elusimicrobium posterum]|uniref:N-acetylmuramic acid 6-phosphate etherase n=1 Tax=Elusimicrobium posterum TaxID=3116653 RepID=UPI003C781D31
MKVEKLNLIPTETRNKKTENLDRLSIPQMVAKINAEDFNAAKAVKAATPQISKAIEKAAASFMKGGKLIFIGAGTSGRLGVLEAAECPPTFSTDPAQIVGIIAGGEKAIFKAKEGAEDDPVLGAKDIEKIVKKGDVVFGIAASGRTPYVHGALKAAKKKKAVTVLISCNNNIDKKSADIIVYLPTGAEALQGSTRMKAGTATKMALNIITTSTMVLCGKVYKNYMIDVKASNEKLYARATRLVSTIAKISEKEAEKFLTIADFNVKTAIVMAVKNITEPQAEKLLKQKKGFLKDIIS